MTRQEYRDFLPKFKEIVETKQGMDFLKEIRKYFPIIRLIKEEKNARATMYKENNEDEYGIFYINLLKPKKEYSGGLYVATEENFLKMCADNESQT